MMVLAMAPLLTNAEPAVVLEKRNEFLDLRWHRPRIVLGLRPVEYRLRLGQLGAHQSLRRMALALPERTTMPRAQVLRSFARDG
jgi:hypothetical protein